MNGIKCSGAILAFLAVVAHAGTAYAQYARPISSSSASISTYVDTNTDKNECRIWTGQTGCALDVIYDNHKGIDFAIGGWKTKTINGKSVQTFDYDHTVSVLAPAGGEIWPADASDGAYDKCHVMDFGKATEHAACDPDDTPTDEDCKTKCPKNSGNHVVIHDQFANKLTFMHMVSGSITEAKKSWTYCDGVKCKCSTIKKDCYKVACGAELGKVGSSGYTTGPHLHFQINSPNKDVVDPFAGPGNFAGAKGDSKGDSYAQDVTHWLQPQPDFAALPQDSKSCFSCSIEPGRHADGSYSESDRGAFENGYNYSKYAKCLPKSKDECKGLVTLGCPTGPVQEIGTVLLQFFSQSESKKSQWFSGSSDGQTALVLHVADKTVVGDVTRAYALHSGFLMAYKCLMAGPPSQLQPIGGAVMLGAPTSNEYLGKASNSLCPADCAADWDDLPTQDVTVQRFEKGFMWWGQADDEKTPKVHVHNCCDENWKVSTADECSDYKGLVVKNPPGPPLCASDELGKCSDGIDNDCNKCTDKEDQACGGCDGKQCGTTKCGQVCGSCTSPAKCNEFSGQCEQCQPKCTGKTCGPDGCGKLCGTCAGLCNDGKCCIPNCTGTVCGDNGCGQLCAQCAGGAKCSADGTCPKSSEECKEWLFAKEWNTLGWFVPANQGKTKGNVKPNGDWLVSPSTKDPQIDVKDIAVDGAKCNHLVAGMSTNCKYNTACIYFRTKNKVTKNDGTEINCTKLGEDHKVCGPTCAKNEIWCNAKFDLSQDLCWTQGGDVLEIRFDYVDSLGQGQECPADQTGDAGFSNIRLYSWGSECAEGTPPEVCYSAGPVSGIKGACSAGVRVCEQGAWSPCIGEVKPTTESCDGQDNNCDGQTDEEGAQKCTDFFVDNDGDGYGSFSKCLCAKAGKYQADSGGDCDDNNAQVNPGKIEQCNGKDDNCKDGVDEGQIAICDDGLFCTSDSCTGGSCSSPVQGGFCKINGSCQNQGALQPGQQCFKCDTALSTSGWSPSSGDACDDKDKCTKNDVCKTAPPAMPTAPRARPTIRARPESALRASHWSAPTATPVLTTSAIRRPVASSRTTRRHATTATPVRSTTIVREEAVNQVRLRLARTKTLAPTTSAKRARGVFTSQRLMQRPAPPPPVAQS